MNYIRGTGEANIKYGPKDFETQDMMDSLGVASIRAQLYKLGYPNRTVPNPKIREWNGVSTNEAFINTLTEPYNWTQAELGAFQWKAIREGSSVRIILENDTTTNSLFYHHAGFFGLPNELMHVKSVPFGTVHQHFEWTEPVPIQFRKRKMNGIR